VQGAASKAAVTEVVSVVVTVAVMAEVAIVVVMAEVAIVVVMAEVAIEAGSKGNYRGFMAAALRKGD
jgi:hypothetical protein